jgi:MCM N-terminal domain
MKNANEGLYFLRVDLDDLGNFDDNLITNLRSNPSEYMPVVRIPFFVTRLLV